MTKQGEIVKETYVYYAVIWYGTTGNCYWSEEFYYYGN